MLVDLLLEDWSTDPPVASRSADTVKRQAGKGKGEAGDPGIRAPESPSQEGVPSEEGTHVMGSTKIADNGRGAVLQDALRLATFVPIAGPPPLVRTSFGPAYSTSRSRDPSCFSPTWSGWPFPTVVQRSHQVQQPHRAKQRGRRDRVVIPDDHKVPSRALTLFGFVKFLRIVYSMPNVDRDRVADFATGGVCQRIGRMLAERSRRSAIGGPLAISPGSPSWTPGARGPSSGRLTSRRRKDGPCTRTLAPSSTRTVRQPRATRRRGRRGRDAGGNLVRCPRRRAGTHNLPEVEASRRDVGEGVGAIPQTDERYIWLQLREH